MPRIGYREKYITLEIEITNLHLGKGNIQQLWHFYFCTELQLLLPRYGAASGLFVLLFPMLVTILVFRILVEEMITAHKRTDHLMSALNQPYLQLDWFDRERKISSPEMLAVAKVGWFASVCSFRNQSFQSQSRSAGTGITVFVQCFHDFSFKHKNFVFP